MDKRETQDKLTDATAASVAPGGPMSSTLAAALAGAQNMTFPELERLANLTIAREQSAMRTDVLFGLSSGSLESQKPGSNLDRHNRIERERLLRQKAKDATSDVTLLAMLDDLAEFEAGLAADYGENFAENLFSDLNAKGLISDEDHKEIMSIQDDAARKKAMAFKIQEGLENGTIKPKDLDGHPWSQEWLDRYKTIEQRMKADAQASIRGDKSVNDMDANGQDETAKVAFQEKPSLTEKFQPAAIGVEQSEYELEDTQEISVNLSNDLGGVSF